MRVGLWGARADTGGLAAMTYEFARHVQPERTMVIDITGVATGQRGPCDLSRYQWGEVVVNRGINDLISEQTVRRFCQGLDVVYAAEVFYREDFCKIAREVGCRTVLHAMPELWHAKDSPPDVVWVPTSWEVDHRNHMGERNLPVNTRVVPVPIPTDTFTPRPSARAVFHLSAPARWDRNGTALVDQALRWMDYDVTVVYGGPVAPPGRPLTIKGRKVDVDWQGLNHRDRQDAYPAECGVLLLPRRYGGLCLPMQEVAALGWPIVTIDLAPQNEWVHHRTLVPPMAGDPVRMLGGWFEVHACNPRQIAETIRRLLEDEELFTEAAAVSLTHAAKLSWRAWTPRYRKLLEDAAAAAPADRYATTRGGAHARTTL